MKDTKLMVTSSTTDFEKLSQAEAEKLSATLAANSDVALELRPSGEEGQAKNEADQP